MSTMIKSDDEKPNISLTCKVVNQNTHDESMVIHWGTEQRGCFYLLRHYLHRSCCQRPGGGQGDTDSVPLPLSPSGTQTGSAERNMRPLLEDKQGNTGWGSVREMGHWITAETHAHGYRLCNARTGCKTINKDGDQSLLKTKTLFLHINYTFSFLSLEISHYQKALLWYHFL